MLSSPNLVGNSQAIGAMLRFLRTQFRVYYLGLKCIRGVVSGVKGLALNPTKKTLIHFKPKK